MGSRWFRLSSILFRVSARLIAIIGWWMLLVNSRAIAEFITVRALVTVDEVFEIDTGSKTILCGGPINGRYVSGSARTVSNTFIFNPLSEQSKSLQAKVKRATGSKRDKLKKKLATLKRRTKSENEICAAGPGGSPPTSSPTPRPSATPTPRPTQTSGNFDSNGNVTSQGKIAFGIPSQLNANRESGQTLYNSSCKGCHSSENTGRSFSTYKATIQGAPMFIFDKSDQEIAHLTAYLNRFKLN